MKRRTLLQAATLPLLGLSGQLWAAPAESSRLLLVFLRGGYDAANLLVPVSSQFYYESRPNIAVARPGKDGASALLLNGTTGTSGANADWGLHPALRDSILPMFNSGQAAFIPFAGTADTSRSHFETQNSIELGQSLTQSRDYRSGFLNRLAGQLNGATPIAFTEELPLVFQGNIQVPNIALKGISKPGVDARQAKIIASMYQNTALANQVNEGFTVRDEVMKEMAGEMAEANRNAVSAKGFELEARRTARLMKEKYNLGFVDIGGWDTHVGQGAGSGYLANRFEELGRGLAGFAQEMGNDWKNTVVVVVSEFGRTLRENGNRGTDHGHGSVYWVLGGSIKGGRVVGEQTRVEAASLFQNRDYPVLNEYRACLGGLMQRMYGLNPGQLEHIFAGVKPRDPGLI